jgi:prepilin-type N-terminal cleavage/methylation domain-containing protein
MSVSVSSGVGGSFRECPRAFTLMELVTAILIIAILLAMILPGFTYLRNRAERATCAQNLRNLYVATTSYIQDRGSWPQIDPGLVGTPQYPEAWIQAMEPYNLGTKNWVCPSVQRALNNPDLMKPETRRIDYLGTPFGTERHLPYKYPRQPWFIERGDMHGEGQLILFPSGQVQTLREVLRDTTVQHFDM